MPIFLSYFVFSYEPRREKTGHREADQRLCFRYIDSRSLYFLNTKFEASSHLVWLKSLVCVGPGQKPRRPVFSERGSYVGVGQGKVKLIHRKIVLIILLLHFISLKGQNVHVFGLKYLKS